MPQAEVHAEVSTPRESFGGKAQLDDFGADDAGDAALGLTATTGSASHEADGDGAAGSPTRSAQELGGVSEVLPCGSMSSLSLTLGDAAFASARTVAPASTPSRVSAPLPDEAFIVSPRGVPVSTPRGPPMPVPVTTPRGQPPPPLMRPMMSLPAGAMQFQLRPMSPQTAPQPMLARAAAPLTMRPMMSQPVMAGMAQLGAHWAPAQQAVFGAQTLARQVGGPVQVPAPGHVQAPVPVRSI